MKRLSLKLLLLYVASMLLTAVIIFMYAEYRNYQEAESDAAKLMEVGPAYINGVTPDDLEAQAVAKGKNIFFLFNTFYGRRHWLPSHSVCQ